MNILLTGGAGFIGSHATARLQSLGHRVTVFDNFSDYYDPALKRANIAAVRPAAVVEGDLRSAPDVEKALDVATPDAIVHLAACAGVRPSLQNPKLYSEVNLGGTLNLLEACRRRGPKRFVFASSSSVYGDADRIPFREDDGNLKPVSPYGVTKLLGEHYLRIYHNLHGLRVSALRFFTVFGPRQRPDMAIHKFARLILDGTELTLFGDGTTFRDYTYVDDAVQGIVGALGRDDGFEIYNIGGAQTIELGALVKLIEKHLGRKAILKYAPEQAGDVRRTSADVSKARERLGYAPSVTFDEGVRRFCEWLNPGRIPPL